MMMSRSLLALLVLGAVGLAAVSASSHGWSYVGDTGPSYWEGICATGSSQSPINIDTSTATYDASLNTSPLSFNGYNVAPTGSEWTIGNNGHTVVVTLPDGYSISGGALTGTYKADQFHMHWGSTNTQGSEHTISGQAYPLEIHIVHHNDQYSFADAVETQGGLAVIGIMVDVDVGATDNTDLQGFFDALSSVVDSDSSSSISPFTLQTLIPDMSSTFYFTYPGSLTTPGCFETVTWTVIDKPLLISTSQMAALRTLKDSSGSALVNNFRPVQELNGRSVRRNTQP